jgi:hypothetical protein
MPDQPHDVVPPENLASPGEMEWGDDVTWWRPGFAESMKHLGWRWLLLVPAIALLIVLALIPFNPVLWQILFMGGAKLLVLVVALPFMLAGRALSQAVKARREPFCIHCGYGLTGLPDLHRCPECGRPYSFQMIDEYRRDPQWFIERWKQRHQVPIHDVPFAAGTARSKRKSKDGT